MATNTLARLFSSPAAVASGPATFGTVTALHTFTIKSIRIVNTGATVLSILLGIGGVAAANQILPSINIAPGGIYEDDLMLVMAAGETLQATTSGAGLTMTISGLDQS